MIHLLFAVHNHQPVGNFDFIFERAYERAYKPFLDVLKAHPGIRLSIHYTGILLDWLEANHPEYLRDVRALCDAGRLEVLGGGYYEPILPTLTEADRLGQVSKLSERIESLFGAKPRGMWLAERVWEPSLVSSIADAGIEYVVLDGSHFKMVGKGDADLTGWFETEDQGRRLKLLPIHDGVRDTIPFRAVEDVIGNLRAMNDAAVHAKGPGARVQVVFGDDGEKFGDWPETYETVYGQQQWLHRFFSAIEAEPATFAVRPLREGVDLGAAQGMVYLPPASYGEMMAWAQNAEDGPRFRSAKQVLRDAGRGDDAERFVRGTFWRNFLAKYPESNRMHKQALRLSRLVDKMFAAKATSDPLARKARDHIWQAQCNCGYWHGVFGGLYLPHLRFGLYRHLIAAQRALDAKLLARKSAAWEATDWNFDGREEHLLNTPELMVAFTAGGAVDQLWLKRTGLNLCDTLTRRPEPYHARIGAGGEGGTKLEDQIAAKEEGLQAYLIYDKRLREMFSEWVLPEGTGFEGYRAQSFDPLAEPVFAAPTFARRASGLEVAFRGEAALPDGALRILKTYRFAPGGGAVDVTWKFTAHGAPRRFRFVAETLFCLLAGNAPDRYVSWAGPAGAGKDILASRGEIPGDARVEVVDEWLRFAAVLTAGGTPGPTAPGTPVSIWRDALETVSQSEGGYERVYQGTVLAPVWDVDLREGGTAEASLRIDLKEGTHGQQTA